MKFLLAFVMSVALAFTPALAKEPFPKTKQFTAHCGPFEEIAKSLIEDNGFRPIGEWVIEKDRMGKPTKSIDTLVDNTGRFVILEVTRTGNKLWVCIIHAHQRV